MIKVLGSSFIKKIDYENKALTIRMKHGEYIYHGVPQSTFNNLKKADSTGQGYNEFIKGKFPCYKKIS